MREGLHLQGLSQYPSETEFLLPMFSMLEVVEVSQREPLELRCKYKSCLMPRAFRSRCLADLEEAQHALDEIGKAALDKNPELAQFLDPWAHEPDEAGAGGS